MKKVIFVAGNSHGEIRKSAIRMARVVGRLIAKNGNILLTGGTLGVPEEAVMGAKEKNGETVAISPGVSMKEHLEKYKQSARSYKYIFTGLGDMGRNIYNIRSCDAVVIIGGGMGTLTEFCMAYAEGKPIGVLLGTGGITSIIKELINLTKKKPKAPVFYSDKPGDLINKISKVY